MIKTLTALAAAGIILSMGAVTGAQERNFNPEIDTTPSKALVTVGNVTILYGPGGQRNESCSVTRDFVLVGEGNGNDRVITLDMDGGVGDTFVDELPPNLGTVTENMFTITSEAPIQQATWTNSDYLPEDELHLIVRVFNETPNGLVQLGEPWTETIPTCFVEPIPCVTDPTQPHCVTPPPTEPSPPILDTIPELPPPTTVPQPNCEELGLVNIPAGDPVYRTDLDLDDDGFACDYNHPAPTPTVMITGSAGNVTPQQTLPHTGSYTLPLVAGGVLLILAGASLRKVVASRS